MARVRVLPGRAIRVGRVLHGAGEVFDYPNPDLARMVGDGVLEAVAAPQPKPKPKAKKGEQNG